MSDWIKYRTEDLIADGRLIIGDGYRAKNSELAQTGLPFARVSNVNDGFHFEDADRFPEENLNKVGDKVSYPGDVVFTSKGTVGRFAFVRPEIEQFVYSPQLCYWRSLDTQVIDPRFLFYWMHGREFWLQVHGVKGQTDMADYVSLRDQRRMFITLPEIEEQKAIAGVLSAFDDKIELNRQMNATLEEMAHALFKSWFVDFDPVRRNQAGQPGQHYDHLFPGRLVLRDGNGRDLPEGWQIGTVGEDFDITMGQSPPGETYNEEGNGLPFYQGRRDFGFRYPSLRVYCSEPKRLAKAGDTLVSVRAPVGEINMAIEDCCVGRGVGAIRHKSGSRSYTFYAMKSLEDYFNKFEAEGTVFGSLNKKDFHNMEFIIPPPVIVKEFEQLTFAIDQLIETNEQEMLILVDLRDTLLSRLMSGQLRVPEQETKWTR